MRVTIQITAGPAVGRQISLQTGQTAQFGRTEWADFSIPQDPELSPVHFALESRPHGCVLRDLGTAGGTLVNGVKVEERVLRSGDAIVAGQSSFLVQIDGEPSWAAPAGASGEAAASTHDASEPPPQSAVELCAGLALSDEGRALLQPGDGPRDYIVRLMARQHLDDAIRVLARWLPKRIAVEWACACVEEGCGTKLTERQNAALRAARQWVLNPDEEHRRAAAAAGEDAAFDGAAAWAAVAAGWSGGSLSPPELPEVPPAEDLTAKAVTAAVILAGVTVEPTRAAEKYQRFLTHGLERAQQQHATGPDTKGAG